MKAFSSFTGILFQKLGRGGKLSPTLQGNNYSRKKKIVMLSFSPSFPKHASFPQSWDTHTHSQPNKLTSSKQKNNDRNKKTRSHTLKKKMDYKTDIATTFFSCSSGGLLEKMLQVFLTKYKKEWKIREVE